MQKIIQKKSPKNKKKKDRIKISKGSPGIVIKSIIGLTSPKASKKNMMNNQLTEVIKNINFSVIQNKNKFEITKGDTIKLQKIKTNDTDNNKITMKSQKCLYDNFSIKNDINNNKQDNIVTDSCKILLTVKKESDKISPRKISFPSLKTSENKVKKPINEIKENQMKKVENTRNKVIRLTRGENKSSNFNNNTKKIYRSFRKNKSNKRSPDSKNSVFLKENIENSFNNSKITKHSRIIDNIDFKDEPLKKYFKRCDVIKISKNKENDLNENDTKLKTVIKDDENINSIKKQKKIITLGKLKLNKSEERLDKSFGEISKSFCKKYMTKDDEIEDETFKGSIRNRYKRQKLLNSESKPKKNIFHE